MKVEIIYEKDLLIVPETEFEKNWLEGFNPSDSFRKYGLSQADFLGIKVERSKDE